MDIEKMMLDKVKELSSGKELIQNRRYRSDNFIKFIKLSSEEFITYFKDGSDGVFVWDIKSRKITEIRRGRLSIKINEEDFLPKETFVEKYIKECRLEDVKTKIFVRSKGLDGFFNQSLKDILKDFEKEVIKDCLKLATSKCLE